MIFNIYFLYSQCMLVSWVFFLIDYFQECRSTSVYIYLQPDIHLSFVDQFTTCLLLSRNLKSRLELVSWIAISEESET